jgi:hypothetical protein
LIQKCEYKQITANIVNSLTTGEIQNLHVTFVP